MTVSDLTKTATKNMNNKKFLVAIEAKLEEYQVEEKAINYVIGKVKQSFKNGVEVGKKQVTSEMAK